MLIKGLELDKGSPHKCLHSKTCCTWSFSQSFIKNCHMHKLVSLWTIEGGWKNTIARTTRINAKEPHWMNHRPNSLEKHKRITTPPILKSKGCAHTNEVEEDSNGMF